MYGGSNLEEYKMKKEYGQCPNCKEVILIHNVGLTFRCNMCGTGWEEREQSDDERLGKSHVTLNVIKSVNSRLENCKGALWFTSMGRIVIDDHSNETFCEPYDIKLMTKEELTNGVNGKIFFDRLWDMMIDRKNGKK